MAAKEGRQGASKGRLQFIHEGQRGGGLVVVGGGGGGVHSARPARRACTHALEARPDGDRPT
jgi:hypothetical protein